MRLLWEYVLSALIVLGLALLILTVGWLLGTHPEILLFIIATLGIGWGIQQTHDEIFRDRKVEGKHETPEDTTGEDRP